MGASSCQEGERRHGARFGGPQVMTSPFGIAIVSVRSGWSLTSHSSRWSSVWCPHAHGQQVVEIGAPTVAPPHDVMDLAVAERHLAVGHRAPRIQRPQHPTLRGVRQSRRAPEVEPTRRVHHEAALHHDRRHHGLGQQILEHRPGKLDRQAPISRRLRRARRARCRRARRSPRAGPSSALRRSGPR